MRFCWGQQNDDLVKKEGVVLKAVLIMNMPENCANCNFSEWRKDEDWGDGDYCAINGGQCLNCKRPKTCPLRMLPEPKSEEFGQTIISSARAEGWNNCLHTITEDLTERGEICTETRVKNG